MKNATAVGPTALLPFIKTKTILIFLGNWNKGEVKYNKYLIIRKKKKSNLNEKYCLGN